MIKTRKAFLKNIIDDFDQNLKDAEEQNPMEDHQHHNSLVACFKSSIDRLEVRQLQALCITALFDGTITATIVHRLIPFVAFNIAGHDDIHTIDHIDTVKLLLGQLVDRGLLSDNQFPSCLEPEAKTYALHPAIRQCLHKLVSKERIGGELKFKSDWQYRWCSTVAMSYDEATPAGCLPSFVRNRFVLNSCALFIGSEL